MMPALQHAAKNGKVYLNPIPTRQGADSLWNVLWKYIRNKEEVVPKRQIGPFRTDLSVFEQVPATGLRITLVGHSSLLIEIDGYRILTDPVWAERASFLKSVGPKRFFEAPFALKDLPKLDAIIQSHDHYDHLDKDAIRVLAGIDTPFYCSEGVRAHLIKWGIAPVRVHEMNWGDTVQVNEGLQFTATPARHFSGRGIVNRNQTLWSSFVIKTAQHNIFFGADSGYFPGFKTIGELYGPFDLTMLEIGASNPAWEDIHMGPVKAAQAHLDLRGKVMMPIHWGTFNLALHAWYEPIETLLKEAADKGITLFVPKPGEPTEVADNGYNSYWWKG